MARQYAARTTVGIGSTKDEIGAELQRMGAVRRVILDDDENAQAAVVFERGGTRYRLLLPLPDPNDRRFSYSPGGRVRYDAHRTRQEWLQACAERWRALGAYIKALRVAQEAGILHLEEALLPYAVLPDGRTVAEYTLPQLPEAAAAQQLPPLLPGVSQPNPAGTVRLIPAPEDTRHQ